MEETAGNPGVPTADEVEAEVLGSSEGFFEALEEDVFNEKTFEQYLEDVAYLAPSTTEWKRSAATVTAPAADCVIRTSVSGRARTIS